MLNETHDPALRSWVPSANDPYADFPVQNLPFAVFRRKRTRESFRGGVAIGDQVLDLDALYRTQIFASQLQEILATCTGDSLNPFMQLGHTAWSSLRLALSRALRANAQKQSLIEACLVSRFDVEYRVPCRIGDYTDFYTSINHATNVGRLFRPDAPLLPNYKWMPIAYHGRASTIGVTGQKIIRPLGQLKAQDEDAPGFGPSRRLDYELEVGIYIGTGNEYGKRIPIEEAEQHIFGYGLFNDWSARDIQAWEYQPLGPFLSKSFASTVSPWIVTSEALLPFRKAWTRPEGDPAPLSYLDSEQNRRQGGLDIQLEAYMHTRQIIKKGRVPYRLSHSTFADSYWTVAQMVAHHTVNGCQLKAGDFFGSGTQSGPGEDEAGSLLELSKGGKQPIELPGGESRTFLEDGDKVIFSGYCEAPGAARIGFGTVYGKVYPAEK